MAWVLQTWGGGFFSDVPVMKASQEPQPLLRKEEASFPGVEEGCREMKVRSSDSLAPALFMEIAFE